VLVAREVQAVQEVVQARRQQEQEQEQEQAETQPRRAGKVAQETTRTVFFEPRILPPDVYWLPPLPLPGDAIAQAVLPLLFVGQPLVHGAPLPQDRPLVLQEVKEVQEAGPVLERQQERKAHEESQVGERQRSSAEVEEQELSA
jgi:hypothetical protein